MSSINFRRENTEDSSHLVTCAIRGWMMRVSETERQCSISAKLVTSKLSRGRSFRWMLEKLLSDLLLKGQIKTTGGTESSMSSEFSNITGLILPGSEVLAGLSFAKYIPPRVKIISFSTTALAHLVIYLQILL